MVSALSRCRAAVSDDAKPQCGASIWPRTSVEETTFPIFFLNVYAFISSRIKKLGKLDSLEQNCLTLKGKKPQPKKLSKKIVCRSCGNIRKNLQACK